MGAFLGSIGDMLEFLHYREKQSVSSKREVKYRTTLDGTRKAQIGPRPLREWFLSNTDVLPEEAAPFELLANGAYGRGPFLLVDPLAQVTNVLSYRMSLPGYDNTSAYSNGTGTASSSAIPGLGTVPSIMASGGTYVTLAYATPVVAGRPVTVSAFMTGSGTGSIQAQFLDAAGTVVSTQSAEFVPTSSWKRVFYSTTAPANAAQVQIRLTATGSYSVALPAVTWTKSLMAYSPGRGCASVVIAGYDLAYADADSNPDGQRLLDFSFTVTEVGNGA